MLSLQSAMELPAGRDLPLPARAAWWTMLAYVLSVRRDAASGPAAKQAVSLWREAGDAGEQQLALSIWVRSIRDPGAELDEACRQLQQSMSTLGESPQSRLRVHGALAEAARVRGDRAALLACREQELKSSLELGWQRTAQAAETNICAVLIELGRHAEAADRGHALMRGIDADAGDDNGNLPWALNVLVEALTALERWSEARALVPRSLDAARRFGTTVAWQGVLVLVAAQQRHVAAGRLLGHVRRQWEARGASPDRDERSRLEQVEAAVRARLGADTATTLAAQGWGLDDAAAARLAAQDID
jgi:non-specific serine/threonine protein kinase